MASSRRLGVRLLGLPGYGEKQQLKNTLMRVNNQEEICPLIAPLSPGEIDDFHLKSSIPVKTGHLKSTGRK
jgi:hypothetical protein